MYENFRIHLVILPKKKKKKKTPPPKKKKKKKKKKLGVEIALTPHMPIILLHFAFYSFQTYQFNKVRFRSDSLAGIVLLAVAGRLSLETVEGSSHSKF